MTAPPTPNQRERVEPGRPPRRRWRRRLPLGVFLLAFAALVAAVFVLAPLIGRDDDTVIAFERAQRHWRATWDLPMPGQPDLARLPERLAKSGVKLGAPIFIRIFKREFELELWMKRDGAFHQFATYPICRWSGGLGPKIQQGDHQAPEGFYSVDARALNRNSAWYRSFNLGYPNAFDAALGRTGSLIMVHGGCASVGCFAMTNPQMGEIWQLVTAALGNGQARFQVQVLPFRMSEEALKSYSDHAALPLWRMLKRGSDAFEKTSMPPQVRVCNGSYEFDEAGVYQNGDGPIENRCRARS